VETPARVAGSIPTRTLGKTGLKLSLLGYGDAALPKAWRNPLSHEDCVAPVRYAYDRGIRYFDKALGLINSGGFDTCMLSYGYTSRGHDSVWTPRVTQLRDDCLAKAHERGMGIVAMKANGGGWLVLADNSLMPTSAWIGAAGAGPRSLNVPETHAD